MAIQIIMALLFATVVIPIGIFFISERKVKSFKSMLAINIVTFFGVMIFATVFMFGNVATAEAAVIDTVSASTAGMAYMAAALVTGLATLGAGIATGQAASAALGALSENEALMGKSLIFVALAEGIAIYGILIAFTILGRV